MSYSKLVSKACKRTVRSVAKQNKLAKRKRVGSIIYKKQNKL